MEKHHTEIQTGALTRASIVGPETKQCGSPRNIQTMRIVKNVGNIEDVNIASGELPRTIGILICTHLGTWWD